MEESGVKEVRVFRPKSLGGTLRLYTRNPDSLLYAGGTEVVRRVQRGTRRVFAFPQKVIYLGNVQELNRISRSQRFLDSGRDGDIGEQITRASLTGWAAAARGHHCLRSAPIRDQ